MCIRDSPQDLLEADEGDGTEAGLSPLGLAAALAAKRGYRLNRGRGAPDTHRAGLELLKDVVDGVVCLAVSPPVEAA